MHFLNAPIIFVKQDNNSKLNKFRIQIDEIDRQIQVLICERAKLATEVANAKKKSKKGTGYYRPEREAQVLRQVIERNQGPLSDQALTRLFREIMSACLAQQKPLNIAYLGPPGTFSEMATYNYFGHSVNTLPENSIEQVFTEVEVGAADFGVVPIENSTEGAVNNTLDMFLSSPLHISGELDLPIHHCFMSTVTDISDVKIVFSHRQSLAQCRAWLKKNSPLAETIAVSSNAEAARKAQLTPHSAAIAGEAAASMYGLRIMHSDIEDSTDNATRFLIIGRELSAPSGVDKTSIMVSAKDQPGVLYHILQPFHELQVSMTRIESRPSRKGKWDYVFFIDLEGHIQDENVAKSIRLLERFVTQLKVLGSYPKSV